jgi:hypothetical protein
MQLIHPQVVLKNAADTYKANNALYRSEKRFLSFL